MFDAAASVAPLTPGRSCPPHYGYSPRVFARAADLQADTLYVVGGLYGNALALDVMLELTAALLLRHAVANLLARFFERKNNGYQVRLLNFVYQYWGLFAGTGAAAGATILSLME